MDRSPDQHVVLEHQTITFSELLVIPSQKMPKALIRDSFSKEQEKAA
jgi:hypothetical protein